MREHGRDMHELHYRAPPRWSTIYLLLLVLLLLLLVCVTCVLIYGWYVSVSVTSCA